MRQQFFKNREHFRKFLRKSGKKGRVEFNSFCKEILEDKKLTDKQAVAFIQQFVIDKEKELRC